MSQLEGLPTSKAAVVDLPRYGASSVAPGAGMDVIRLVDGRWASVNLVRLRHFDDPHVHEHHDEVVYVIDGQGMFRLGDDILPVAAGQLVFIPAGIAHTPVIQGEVLVLSLFAPRLDPDQPDRVRIELPRTARGDHTKR